MDFRINKPRRFYRLLRVPGRLVLGLIGKADSLWNSLRLTRRRAPLSFSCAASGFSRPYRPSTASTTASEEDRRLCSSIREATVAHNRNNVTRTAAYLNMYQSHPELQWAFLAHLVSRNGGWSMTDLKGQWLPGLIDESFASSLFNMLEASNSLIFGDAYPQLKLYAEGIRLNRDLSYLLPEFAVSSFMTPFWERFRLDQDPVPLAIALIVNEQHFIQSRVVEDADYKRDVFDSFVFRSQPLLQLNQIVFPLWRDSRVADVIPMRLVGRVLENFEDLHERVEFGKSLYGILFGYPDVHKAIWAFASSIPHTGSRADYWPHRFSNDRTAKAGGTPGDPNVAAGQSRPSMWLSPPLAEAWPDQALRQPQTADWFARHDDAMKYVKPPKLHRIIDMTHEHLFGQHKLQAALLLERSFMNGANNRRTGRG
ncbi:DUF2515 domain-containing protein [Cohnella endophytica]|uniref:DUF2515 domain-containing protein n=1 Tax=Cohnella endophytica TaxID=2419778 RepID=A0A494Y1L2_9BACL|nr:DUF2515 family protein [Cohnella endophytica]RKP56131.1 DUF2515 domain-containing protein [Cohnella endophytica]